LLYTWPKRNGTFYYKFIKKFATQFWRYRIFFSGLFLLTFSVHAFTDVFEKVDL